MNKIKNWFFKPYPFIEDVVIKLALSFSIGLVCFVILAVFRPFGLAVVENVTYFSGLGLIATLIMLIHLFLFPFLLPKYFSATNWNISKQLFLFCSILIFISFLNYLYNSTIGLGTSPQYGFLDFLWMTSAVGFFPILLMTYVVEKVEDKRNKDIAKEIDLGNKNKVESKMFNIIGKNQQDQKLSLIAEDFIYAQSSNNYCTIHYLSNDELKQSILRLSLKNLCEQLDNESQFIRCHKSFVVNKSKILSVEGNARSLFLNLKMTEDEIPVSRSFNSDLLN